MWSRWIGVVVLAACSQPAAKEAAPSNLEREPVAPVDPTVHDLPNAWASGAGCIPKGDELVVTGTLVVSPFGKGTDGATVEGDDGEWIITYRAEGPVLALAGRRVTVRGWACDKQGASVFGNHFDAKTIVETP
jgi:hypothetical protein